MEKPKVLIGMPTMHTLPVETMQSLIALIKTYKNCDCATCDGSLVYESRDKLAQAAINGGYDYLMFIDSDMTFPPDALDKLISTKKDIVSGLCFTKSEKALPCAFSKIVRGNRFKDASRTEIGRWVTTDKNDCTEIAGCGGAFLLINTKVLVKIGKRCREWFRPEWHLGEDLAFCERAKKCGYKIWLMPYIAIGHIGTKVYGADNWV